MDIYSSFATRFEKTREEEFSLEEYLALCKEDPATYATAGERMLTAIGDPEQVDTRLDPRLSRVFANKVIKVYPAFRRISGMLRKVLKRRSRFCICSAPWAAASRRSRNG
jgi:serine protein kinase